MMKETIEFAKRLNPRRAQFSLLTPYPGSKTYEMLKDRLLTTDWGLFSGLHPVIDMDHLSASEMRSIQIAAYWSFYARPRKAIENLSYVRRALPSATGFLAARALARVAAAGYHPVAQSWKYIAGAQRLLG
jgi:hypothetical protein